MDRSVLDKVPDEERTAFLMIGHFANQLAILSKWACCCDAKAETSKLGKEAFALEQGGCYAQWLLVTSLLTGKLAEGWDLLQKEYFGRKLSRQYDADLHVEVAEALRSLKRYFSSSNLVRTARNRFAFHYDTNMVREGYGSIPSHESFNIYLSAYPGLCLFELAEIAVSHAILAELGNGSPQKGAENLVEECLKLTGLFQEFIGGFALSFLQRHGVPDGNWFGIAGAPRLDAVGIPFLVEPVHERYPQSEMID
jgi:hypothetical protein